LQIREANEGETVGYGASYRVPKRSKLAIIAAGYADGMLRSLSNHQGNVFIGGKKCPILGRVSMDAIITDISEVSGNHEWAEIIGEHQSVDDVAAQAKTIGYEIFTSLGSRYKRIYKGL
jgi:alanine racemase